MTFDLNDIVKLVLWVIAGVFAICLLFALTLNKTAKDRWAWSITTVGFFALMLWLGYDHWVAQPKQVAVAKAKEMGTPSQQEFKERYAKAKALFDERCKTAGEKIYKTVEGVEAIQLLNIRQNDRPGAMDNPLWPDAALPRESFGDWYIKTFLFFENHDDKRSERGYLTNVASNLPGYKYVEIVVEDGKINRYELEKINTRSELTKTSTLQKSTRYAIGFTNPMDYEDRKNWIAGTKITVTDTQTKEVIAERTSYAFEPGLGGKGGDRQPWGFAVTCPALSGWDGGRTRFFVDQVLKPIQGK
jgi:hypothetical protein